MAQPFRENAQQRQPRQRTPLRFHLQQPPPPPRVHPPTFSLPQQYPYHYPYNIFPHQPAPPSFSHPYSHHHPYPYPYYHCAAVVRPPAQQVVRPPYAVRPPAQQVVRPPAPPAVRLPAQLVVPPPTTSAVRPPAPALPSVVQQLAPAPGLELENIEQEAAAEELFEQLRLPTPSPSSSSDHSEPSQDIEVIDFDDEAFMTPEEDYGRFEDVLPATASPSAYAPVQLIVPAPACTCRRLPSCRACQINDPVYLIDLCGHFGLCQECFTVLNEQFVRCPGCGAHHTVEVRKIYI